MIKLKTLSPRQVQKTSNRQCGLCGKRTKLVKTDCCNNWICDDADSYILFSYARNSCYRNHDRFTLCASHKNEEHIGEWQTCKDCLNSFDIEDYVWYGTNEYNFVKLENPPKFKPTHCAKCDCIIQRGEDSYLRMPDGRFFCETCSKKIN